MRIVTDSSEAVRAYVEAEDIAARAGQALSSAHLLLAMFLFPNRAQVLLRERSIDERQVRLDLRMERPDPEPQRTVVRLKDRAREIARGAEAAEVDCLHVLVAISRVRDCYAYRILQRSGTSLTALRNVAVSYITGNLPRRFRALPKDGPEADEAPLAAPRARLRQSARAERQRQTRPEPAPQTTAQVSAVASPARSSKAAVAVTTEPLRLEEIAPTLAGCSLDLTAQARQGMLDSAIGRQREVEALVDVLGKRRANNPVLVGAPGVGKTAIVEGLAVKIARRDADVAHFHDRMVVALDTGALVAGTSLRGAFSERLGAIKAEVAAAQRQIVVFIDELHTLIGAGTSGEGPQDAANELKAALARGEFPCIGATTVDEFKKYIEKDAALERRFTPIYVEEPTPDETLRILQGAIGPYAAHHGLEFSLESIHAAVWLSHRFVTERKLPDKAFASIDLAGSRARRRRARRVERIDVAQVVYEWSGVPLERLVEADAQRFANLEDILSAQLVGHARVVRTVAQAVRRGFAGFNGQRPMSSLLFVGPTGVGKTELVKVLAEFLFGRRDAMIRFDMSELAEKHAVARLIGAQPGYIGYDEGGQLTEALRKRPFQIVLFDEVEKAHPDVLNLLLQILDEGQLTDSRGRRISFANSLVVLTSNAGAEQAGGSRTAIGFGQEDAGPREDGLLDGARRRISPELWGRLDERVAFLPLSRAELARIGEALLQQTKQALLRERRVGLTWTGDVVEFLLTHGGFCAHSGARPMRQCIQRHVEAPMAELLLSGKLRDGGHARLSVSSCQTHLVVDRSPAARSRRLDCRLP